MGRGGECSATVDLCELDLISGTASFLKSGAAPTYIARGSTVYKIYSRTMPIGILKSADTRISKFDTQSGDIIVMMSDGCCPDSEDCAWLVEFLCAYTQKKDRNALGKDAECEELKDAILSLEIQQMNISIDVLNICNKRGIPMVLDVHHHNCNKSDIELEENSRSKSSKLRIIERV